MDKYAKMELVVKHAELPQRVRLPYGEQDDASVVPALLLHGFASDLAALLTALLQIWAKFPANLLGRISEWYAKSLLNVVDRDREHARRELRYLKRAIEEAS